MAAVIENYNLAISEEAGENNPNIPPTRYEAVWDGWVTTDQAIDSLLRNVKYQIEKGCKPIVAVFTPD